MDSRDATDALLPARLAPIRAALPAAPPTAATAADGLSSLGWKTVARGLARYWRLIVPLWLVGSVVALGAIYALIEPTYEVNSLLKVEPTSADLFNIDHGGATSNAGSTYLANQVQLIRSDAVLTTASLYENVAGLPLIVESKDAVTAIRKQLQVDILPGTTLVTVGMRGSSPDGATQIVNAVVDAFIAYHGSANKDANRVKLSTLEEAAKKLEGDSKLKEDELIALVDKGIGTINPREFLSSLKDDDGVAMKMMPEQYRDLQNQLIDATVALTMAESVLERRRPAIAPVVAEDPEVERLRLEQRIQVELQNDPNVAGAVVQLNEATTRFEEAKRRARKAGDPTVTQAKVQADRALTLYKQVREARARVIQASLARAVVRGEEGPGKEYLEAEDRVRAARARKARVEELLGKMEVDRQKAASDQVRAMITQRQVDHLKDMHASLSKRIEQVAFESKGEDRVFLIDAAKPTYTPTKDPRVRMMAAAPLGLLLALLGLTTLLEARSGRVTHPDDLAARVRAEVFAVPPLPTLRAGRSDDKRLERLEEFAQRLDHLRVALCGPAHAGGSAAGPGGARCLVISSAIGGEGKTTLAAQLAGRCANAGLSTLLIDADLRRPMLARLLEVPEQPGLAEVLAGEAEAEAALVVIGNAGGFHLMPAGGPGHDPGRLLNGPAFGQLVGRLRQAFDVVIVDTSPILPVPDAIQVSRWADGVVLATRHDTSRSKLVERAGRTLDSAGIPILGVVVNGTRGADASYGSYPSYNSRNARAGRA